MTSKMVFSYMHQGTMFVAHYLLVLLFQTAEELEREEALERARAVREQKRIGAYESIDTNEQTMHYIEISLFKIRHDYEKS